MIKISNLTTKVGKNNERVLLNNVSLEIPQNKITAFVGDSGIGKTTLLWQIAKIKNSFSKSIIYFDHKGNEILDPKIDLVFQDFNLFNNLNVMENLQIGNGVLGYDLDKDNLIKQANSINIKKEILNSDIKKLSGGEQQRVAILRAINRQADFILLDEPTGNLDLDTSKLIFETLKELSTTKTIVVVSHNYELVKEYADKIVRIEDSQFVIEKDDSQPFNNNSDNILRKTNHDKLSVKNKLKIATKFIKNDLKTKTWQVLLIILTFIIALFSTLIIFNLNIGTTRFNQTFISGNNLDLFKISKKDNSNFSDDDIKNLKQEPNINKAYTIIPKPANLRLKYNNNTAISFSQLQVTNDAFFEQRFKTLNEVKGSFIQNKNEIVINENFANILGLKNPINQTITLQPYFTSNFQDVYLNQQLKNINYEIKIVGSFKTPEYNNAVNFWIHQDLLKELGKKTLTILSNSNELFQTVSKVQPNNWFSNSTRYAPKSRQDLNVKLVEGKMPDNYNEIIVSNSFLEDSQQHFGFKLNEEITAKLKTDLPELTMKIVGIYEGDEPEIRYHHDLIDQYFENSNSLINLFINSYGESLNIEFLNALSTKYHVYDSPDSIIFELLQNGKLIQLITFGIFIIFIALFFSFLVTYLKSLSDSKRKSIGILKALRTKPRWIIFYQSLHLFVILLAVFIVGIPLVLSTINPVINLITGIKALETNAFYNFWTFTTNWILLSFVAIIIFAIISFIQYRRSTNDLLY